jgi:peroxiredoxin (alkyl hydroperoxide reductase subunit C)
MSDAATAMRPVGAAAPDFALLSHAGATVRLSDFRGRKHVVLAFHVLAFTPVCAVQMQTYEREQPRFAALDTHVLAISTDAAPAKRAWADALGGISFDLLSDFHPRGQVAASYGVMRDDGIAERALFLVDKTGTIRWSRLYAIPEQPDIAELMAAVQTVQGA